MNESSDSPPGAHLADPLDAPRLGRALWASAPELNFFFYAVGIAHAELCNLAPPRFDLWPTVFFPLLVPSLLFALRWRTAGPVAHRRMVGIFVVTALLLGASFFGVGTSPLDPSTLRDIYEPSAVLNTVVLMLHAARRSRGQVWLHLGPLFAYGVLLENGGILLGYFSELDYRWYLGPLVAPLATMSGWVTVFYLVLHVMWEVQAKVPLLRARPALGALAAVGAGLALDLQIDPLATAVGFWRWNDLLDPGPFGVPLLNFVAWGAAIYPLAWLMARRSSAANLAPAAWGLAAQRRWLWPRVPLALALATVLFLGCMTLIERSISGPTYQVLRQTGVRHGLLGADVYWTPGTP